jgi:hypothetical protein
MQSTMRPRTVALGRAPRSFRSGLALSILAAGTVMAGCSDGNEPDTVSLHMIATTIGLGETLATPLSAYRKDGWPIPDGELRWSTSDPKVLAIVRHGIVAGVGFGVATLTVSSGAKSSSASLTVGQPVASLDLVPSNPRLNASSCEAIVLSAIARDASGAPIGGRAVAWQSADPRLAKINAEGKVTALDSGDVLVSARLGNRSANTTVYVTGKTDVVGCGGRNKL